MKILFTDKQAETEIPPGQENDNYTLHGSVWYGVQLKQQQKYVKSIKYCTINIVPLHLSFLFFGSIWPNLSLAFARWRSCNYCNHLTREAHKLPISIVILLPVTQLWEMVTSLRGAIHHERDVGESKLINYHRAGRADEHN